MADALPGAAAPVRTPVSGPIPLPEFLSPEPAGVRAGDADATLHELRAAVDDLHVRARWRVCTLAHAARALAQFSSVHRQLEAQAKLSPGFDAAMRDACAWWREPTADDGGGLPELLRLLAEEADEVAARAERLAEGVTS